MSDHGHLTSSFLPLKDLSMLRAWVYTHQLTVTHIRASLSRFRVVPSQNFEAHELHARQNKPQFTLRPPYSNQMDRSDAPFLKSFLTTDYISRDLGCLGTMAKKCFTIRFLSANNLLIKPAAILIADSWNFNTTISIMILRSFIRICHTAIVQPILLLTFWP